MRPWLEEMEAAWEQHRRALRREVTTRVKVGLDYGEGRGGRAPGRALHLSPLFSSTPFMEVSSLKLRPTHSTKNA